MNALTDQLKKIRGVSADMAQGNTGSALIKTIEKALASDKKLWPEIEKRKIIPPAAQSTIEILKTLLRIECAQQGVAAKLVASGDDLEAMAMEDNPDVPAMHGWRYEIFGKEAQALKAGRIAIGLKKGRIVKYDISGETQSRD